MNNTTRFHNENNCTSVQESIQTTSNVLYTVKEVSAPEADDVIVTITSVDGKHYYK